MEQTYPAPIQPDNPPEPMQDDSVEPPAEPPKQPQPAPEKPVEGNPVKGKFSKKPLPRKRRPTRDVGTNTILIQTPHGVKRRIIQAETRFCLITGNGVS